MSRKTNKFSLQVTKSLSKGVSTHQYNLNELYDKKRAHKTHNLLTLEKLTSNKIFTKGQVNTSV